LIGRVSSEGTEGAPPDRGIAIKDRNVAFRHPAVMTRRYYFGETLVAMNAYEQD